MYEDSNYSTFLTILVIIVIFMLTFIEPTNKIIFNLHFFKKIMKPSIVLNVLIGYLIPCLEKYLFKYFAHVLIELFDFLKITNAIYIF